MVIAILGILAGIALTHFTAARLQGYNASAKSDLKNAYNAAQAFFSDSPGGAVNPTNLQSYGYRPTAYVNLIINDGTESGLSMTASYSFSGSTTYTVDSIGVVSP